MLRLLILAIVVLQCTSVYAQPLREVRGVWLTTNGGMDWPAGRYDESSQKKSLVEMLDRLAEANFNMVLFQVQANGDVAWNSSLQPAMESLTGNGSRSLSYDVCRFVIDECHKRSMECHAWVVPFRIGSSRNAARYASNKVKHPLKSHRDLCVLYSGGYYLDPGLPETRKYLLKLYKELIEKYDFDGINLDYTRYPGDKFNDASSFKAYNPGKLSRDDWRRANINEFVAQLHDMAKKVRPGIRVGSAPIGTYKNVDKYKNATSYFSYQQDPCQWLESGHHDFIIPQMYWNEDFGFTPNMVTWVNNSCKHPVVVGLAPYKLVDSKWDVDVIIDQIEKTRRTDGVAGVCFFRAEHLLGNNPKIKRLYDALRKDVFNRPAHLPQFGSNKAPSPRNVKAEYSNGGYVITWDAPRNCDVRYYSVYLTDDKGVRIDQASDDIVGFKVKGNSFNYRSSKKGLKFAVTAFDRDYSESDPVYVNRGKDKSKKKKSKSDNDSSDEGVYVDYDFL